MQAVSLHIVDVANGVVATGMGIDIARRPRHSPARDFRGAA